MSELKALYSGTVFTAKALKFIDIKIGLSYQCRLPDMVQADDTIPPYHLLSARVVGFLERCGLSEKSYINIDCALGTRMGKYTPNDLFVHDLSWYSITKLTDGSWFFRRKATDGVPQLKDEIAQAVAALFSSPPHGARRKRRIRARRGRLIHRRLPKSHS